MVTTRSGTTTVHRMKRMTCRHRDRKPLLKRHLRTEGSNEHHECSVCQTKMYVTTNCNAMSQCPSCADMIHTACLIQWIKNCENVASCPNCRSIIPGTEESTLYLEEVYVQWEPRCSPWDSDDESVVMSIDTNPEYDEEEEDYTSDDNSFIHHNSMLSLKCRRANIDSSR